MHGFRRVSQSIAADSIFDIGRGAVAMSQDINAKEYDRCLLFGEPYHRPYPIDLCRLTIIPNIVGVVQRSFTD